MEARLVALKTASEKKLSDICSRLEQANPEMSASAGNAGAKLVQDAIQEVKRAWDEMATLVSSTESRSSSKDGDLDSGFDSMSEVSLDDESDHDSISHRPADETQSTKTNRSGFIKDTISRIRTRLDDMYRSDAEAKAVSPDCDIDEIARLINEGKNDDALKLIIKNSSDIEDVLKMSAAALDRAGGVNGRVKDELRRVDYVAMCAKYATSSATHKRTSAITHFVDNVLYEGLLDGKIYPSDFSDKYEPLEELIAAVEDDQETTNENARRFLALLTKTLLPVTSVILKATVVVTLIFACVTPLTAGLMCASALALDTMTQVLKSRFVRDMLTTFMSTAESGKALNEALSNRYVKKLTSLLLHEAVTGTIKVCHVLSGGNFCKS